MLLPGLTLGLVTHSQWSPNGPVSLGQGQHPGITSDGAGGCIVARYTGSLILAHRINASGAWQWGATIGAGFGQQVPVSLVNDGAAGAIFAWISASGLIAQKVNSAGVLQWPSPGVTICTGSNSSFNPSITGDGAGGAFITWFDHRGGSSIYIQHVDASGALQLVPNGIAVCTGSAIEIINSYGPSIVDDGSGGAIISWRDNRNGNPDIYAQRVNAIGTPQWPLNGMAICALTSNQGSLNMQSDGAGGAIIAWGDNRNANNDIYAQRVNGSGTALWTIDGVGVCSLGGDDSVPMIVEDGTGGAVIAWMRGGGIYAQKVNSPGEVQWMDPVAISTNPGIAAPTITGDGAGGAIVAWMGLSNGSYYSYVQRVLASGLVVWTPNGINVWPTSSSGYPVIVNSGSNGTFVCLNSAFFPPNTYAQFVNSDGTIGPMATPIISCPASNTSINTNLSGATYQWQVNTGSGFVNISDNTNYVGTNSANLQLINIPSSWYGYNYRCMVNSAYSTNFKLKFADNWTGISNTNWEDPANWSCGAIPDTNTDVVISSGTVTINTNVTIRTLTIAPGANLSVSPGVQLTITH